MMDGARVLWQWHGVAVEFDEMEWQSYLQDMKEKGHISQQQWVKISEKMEDYLLKKGLVPGMID